jgi:hypothetical protein
MNIISSKIINKHLYYLHNGIGKIINLIGNSTIFPTILFGIS